MPDLRIEYPSRGRTYVRQEYGVYQYGVYPPSSVLAGQQSRVFKDSFETLEEAQKAYPTAVVSDNCDYTPPFVNHLSDDGDL